MVTWAFVCLLACLIGRSFDCFFLLPCACMRLEQLTRLECSTILPPNKYFSRQNFLPEVGHLKNLLGSIDVSSTLCFRKQRHSPCPNQTDMSISQPRLAKTVEQHNLPLKLASGATTGDRCRTPPDHCPLPGGFCVCAGILGCPGHRGGGLEQASHVPRLQRPLSRGIVPLPLLAKSLEQPRHRPTSVTPWQRGYAAAELHIPRQMCASNHPLRLWLLDSASRGHSCPIE